MSAVMEIEEHQHELACVPQCRETQRDRANITEFDGGDVDENGHWYGAEMSCLECRETEAIRIGVTTTYLLAQLVCGECGESFAQVWQ